MSDLALYTYRDLARLWQLSPKTVQAWMSCPRCRSLPRVRRHVGGARWMVFLSAQTAAQVLRTHHPGLFP